MALLGQGELKVFQELDDSTSKVDRWAGPHMTLIYQPPTLHMALSASIVYKGVRDYKKTHRQGKARNIPVAEADQTAASTQRFRGSGLPVEALEIRV